MSRRSIPTVKAPRPSKPPGSSGGELPRSVRPSHLAPSSEQAPVKVARTTKSTLSDNNNSLVASPHTSARDNEPATDEDSQLDNTNTLVDELMEQDRNLDLHTAERQAVQMLTKITKRSERNHQKYDAFRGSISGKDKQIDELHASFEDLIRQTAGLETLCNSDMDTDTLEELFQTIPLQQRLLHLNR